MPDLSDFIVYADESGDHGLCSIDREYPVFANEAIKPKLREINCFP